MMTWLVSPIPHRRGRESRSWVVQVLGSADWLRRRRNDKGGRRGFRQLMVLSDASLAGREGWSVASKAGMIREDVAGTIQ